MKIPVAKPFLSIEEARAAEETILSGWVTQGPKVEEFEMKFADFVGAKYAVALSNCTTALHLSLIVAGIRKGDEVICPSMTFIATSNAIIHVGAIPVFAEVQSGSYNIDPKSIEQLITPRTKAIIAVHQIGMPADIDAIKDICKKYSLVLIEDAACAAGSKYKGAYIGSHSDLVCFSFHPRKVITTGDGGMITTNNYQYYERLKILRQHGMSVNDRVRHASSKVIFEEYLEVGFNYRMTDIQASVGIEQLKRLNSLVEERRRIAFLYHQAFKDISYFVLPLEKDNYYSNYQSYSIYIKKESPIERDQLMQELLDRGISTRRGVMTIHREKAYNGIVTNICLPVSEDLSDRSIILPLYYPMRPEEIEYVISNIRDLLAQYGSGTNK